MFAEVNDTPVSDTEKALRELESEGEVIQGREKAPQGPEDTKEEKPEDPKPSEKVPSKSSDDEEEKPKEIPAWKAAINAKRAAKEAQEGFDVTKTPEYQKILEEKESLQQKASALENEIVSLRDKQDDLKDLPQTRQVDSEIKKLQEQIDALQSKEREAQQESFYEGEFADTVLPIIKADFPNLSDKSLKEIKDKLKTFAFSTHIDSPLVDIYNDIYGNFGKEIAGSVPQKGRKSAEVSKGQVDRGEFVDLENLSEEDIDKMTPEEFEKVMIYKRNQGKK